MFFFRPSFHYCSSSVHYCEDLFHEFHIFTVVYSSFYGLIWNQHNDQLSVGLLALSYLRLFPQFKYMTFTYSQSFIRHFTGLSWNQHNDQLPFGRALHRYPRGHGFKSRTGLNLFPALFSLLPKYCSLLRRSLS